MIIDLNNTGLPTPKGCHALRTGMSSLRDLIRFSVIFYNSAIPSGLKARKASFQL